MRTTTNTARGKPLAVALLFLLLACTSWVVWGEGSLQVEQSLSPTVINVVGAGSKPDTATVGISLVGQNGVERYPVDCVFVIDTSASALLGDAKAFAFNVISQLGASDRVAVVSFGSTARLDVPLTWDRTEARVAISDLVSESKSALGLALQMARQELQRYGRPEAVLAIVLIADGQSNVGAAPTVEGMVAGETGIRILTAGLPPILNRSLLTGLADQSGGVFVKDLSDESLAKLVENLDVRSAATNVVVTKHVPVGLHFAGSTPTAAQLRTERDGSTTIAWQIAEVGLGQTVRIEARFDAGAKGSLITDDLSKVTYRDFRGVTREAPLSPLVVSVVMPNRAPAAGFSYEPAAPTVGVTVSFKDQSRDVDDDDVVAWRWNFGDGSTADVERPEHAYGEAGTYSVSLYVTDAQGVESEATTRTIVVGNGIPVPSFVLRDPDTLRTLSDALIGGEVLLDATGSYDLDGTIARYGWDINGDGVIDETTTKPTYTVMFPAAGEYTVGLTVTDDYGSTASTTATFLAVSSLTTQRIIETGLPDDETIAGAVVRVTILISANAILNGLGVTETVPEGWTFASVKTDGASLKNMAATGVVEWVFGDRLDDSTTNVQREIQYTLTAPAGTPAAERQAVTVRGSLVSSSPRLNEPIQGEDRITLRKTLPVPVAISCWNVKTSAIDLSLSGKIQFDQIQYAIGLWQESKPVPLTNDSKVDLLTLQDLIAYWLTDRSVFDPLP